MRFYRDAPHIETPVIWYIVPYDTPELGLDTIFGNKQWDWDTVGDELGDVPFGGGFYGGAAPTSAGGCGLVGTPEQWLHGCLTTDPLPPLDPLTGKPVPCCGRRFLGMGGVGLGAPTVTHFLLQENEGRLLTEDGSRLLWE